MFEQKEKNNHNLQGITDSPIPGMQKFNSFFILHEFDV